MDYSQEVCTSSRPTSRFRAARSLLPTLSVGSVLSAAILTGCDSQSKYEALQAQNQQQAQQISRLQGAIKYIVNSDLLFPLQSQGITSNQVLSQKRADNVREYLISQGFSPDLVLAKGWGDANPVASNDTAEGRTQNRRVELTVAGS
jgi:chemotaxis protein MotB